MNNNDLHEEVKKFEKRTRALDYERLSEDSQWQCGKMSFGSKTDKHAGHDMNPERCQNRAVWERKSTCGCGTCNMTRRYCSECMLVIIEDELNSTRGIVDKAISLVRKFDKEILSDNMALLLILGFNQYPPDKPDELWYRNHPNVDSTEAKKT